MVRQVRGRIILRDIMLPMCLLWMEYGNVECVYYQPLGLSAVQTAPMVAAAVAIR